MVSRDYAEHLVGQWAVARPDLDPAPMETVVRIMRVAALLEAKLSAVAARHGLAVWEFEVLATLRRNGPDGLPPRRLLRELMLSSGGITHRIDRLEEAGLVERFPDPDDRRGTIVRLTPAGLARVDPVIAARFDDARAVANRLGRRESAALNEGLRTLALALQPRSW